MIHMFLNVFYVTVAAVCATAGMKTGRMHRGFWYGLAALLLFLAADRALEWSAGLTQFGRFLAESQGWYRMRRPLQREVIIGISGVMALLGGWAAWRMRRFPKRFRLAFAGGLFLCGLAAVQMVSYHYADAVLRHRTVKFRVQDLLALAALGGIALAAAAQLMEGDPVCRRRIMENNRNG